MIANPAFKGEWKAKTIKNPAYKVLPLRRALPPQFLKHLNYSSSSTIKASCQTAFVC
jgi:hypothetical protein